MLSRVFTLLIGLSLSTCVISQTLPTLTIYTYQSFISEFGPGQSLKALFEEQCQCRIHYVALDDGVMLLNRLKMEGKRSQADVVMGLDNHLIPNAEKTGLFAPHQQVTTSLNMPWRDTHFLPYDYSYFAFVYRQDKIANPPNSLEALLDPNQPWRIIYPDPRASTPGLGLVLWMQKIFGDNVTNKWRQLAAKTVTIPKGWSEAYGLFLKGEADFVLSYHTSPIVHQLNDQDSRYAALTFQEGHFQQVEVAAITKMSQQPALAKQFLTFLLTPAAQQQLAIKNIMYPVIDIPLPEAFHRLPPVTKILTWQTETLEQNQKQWITTWRNAITQ